MRDLDWLFLGVENEVSHMHLGAVAVFEGPPPSYDRLARLVAAKLPALAHYRQRLRFVPFDLGRPLWVTDPGFQLGYHLRHTALPHPGRDSQLRRLSVSQSVGRGGLEPPTLGLRVPCSTS